MQTIHESSRHHYREPRDKGRLLRTLIITLVVLAIIAVVAFLGYRWYQSVNDQPPMSVSYIHHEEAAKSAPQLYQTMSLKLSKAMMTLSYGQTGTIAATTAAGAQCKVNLYFRDGNTQAGAGMKPKTANSKGEVSWTWVVSSKSPAGIWPFTVECRNPTGDQKADGKVKINDPNFTN